MSYAPPIQGGIHMVEEDDQFHVAVSIRNQTDDEVYLQTMDSRLFNVSMKERDFETGYEHRWSPDKLAAQAITHWTMEPDSRVTTHYPVPNREQAREQARSRRKQLADTYEELFDEGDLKDRDDEIQAIMDDPETLPEDEDYGGVNPDDVGLVTIDAGLPATKDYSLSITRQYDLRTNKRDLDDELPPATGDAIEMGR